MSFFHERTTTRLAFKSKISSEIPMQHFESSPPQIHPLQPVLRGALGILALLSAVLAGCTATTSGSQRLDTTGKQITDATDQEEPTAPPASPGFYITGLRGGIVSRMAGLSLSKSDKSRALEAEYKTLETAPSGQIVTWTGSNGASGRIIAAAPYQVGAQNCRQYSHTISTAGGQNYSARSAACRNADGTWAPLS